MKSTAATSRLIVLLLAASLSDAFTPTTTTKTRHHLPLPPPPTSMIVGTSASAAGNLRSRRHVVMRKMMSPLSESDVNREQFEQFDGMIGEEMSPSSMVSASTISAISLALWSLSATTANAAGPDWGIFEGRTGSLLHPVMMFGMLALSVSTALLGFEWRRQRTIGDDIASLKKTLPDLGGASTVADALAAAKAADTPDKAMISKLQAAVPIESEIKELQAERKELAEKGPRDKHYGQGAWLALLGTWFAIEGPLNTYARAGKLFPGPHLYAGAGLVCLWALAVATIPQMQKGSDTARYVHIGANISGIALFAWQVQSGIPILLKVIELTKWP